MTPKEFSEHIARRYGCINDTAGLQKEIEDFLYIHCMNVLGLKDQQIMQMVKSGMAMLMKDAPTRGTAPQEWKERRKDAIRDTNILNMMQSDYIRLDSMRDGWYCRRTNTDMPLLNHDDLRTVVQLALDWKK